jgi:hypothetical protein
VKAGPQFQPRHSKSHGDVTPTRQRRPQPHDTSKASSGRDSRHDHDDSLDWWGEDDLPSARSGAVSSGPAGLRRLDSAASTCHSRGSSFRSRGWDAGRVAKKASERSISSVLLLSPAHLNEPDSAAACSVLSPSSPRGAGDPTNPACFAVTNPQITQHIFKVSTRA